MLRGLLSFFLMKRLFRMFTGSRHGGYSHHRRGYGGWNHRHGGGSALTALLGGLHRRRRSFI